MYDSSCQDLATGFLEDTEQGATDERVKGLAQAIQDTIEEWIENERNEGDRDTMPEAG